jgi:hypothetical protein
METDEVTDESRLADVARASAANPVPVPSATLEEEKNQLEGPNGEMPADYDPALFEPREIAATNDKPMELELEEHAQEGEQFKDFPRHDGTAFFRYRLQDWKLSASARQTTARVSFDKVIIREHNLCPGDNPACSDSLPIQLDWDHTPVRVWTIDDFEKVKYMFPIPEDAEGMARRLSWTERRELLMDVGEYTDREIRTAEQTFTETLEEDRKALAAGGQGGGFFSRLFTGTNPNGGNVEGNIIMEEEVATPDAPTAEIARV